MIRYLKEIFEKSKDEGNVVLDPNKMNGKFTLKIDNLVIGYLSAKNGQWEFAYSEEFKNQDKYYRIVGFSDINKVYKSDVLWPFFKIRIPGLKQPFVKEIIAKEKISDTNEFELLKRFGRNIISNPYILEYGQ